MEQDLLEARHVQDLLVGREPSWGWLLLNRFTFSVPETPSLTVAHPLYRQRRWRECEGNSKGYLVLPEISPSTGRETPRRADADQEAKPR